MKFWMVIFLVIAIPCYAASDLHPFSNPIEEQRYQSLIQEVRCVVCQGQSIAESNAPLANDLRDKIAFYIKDGKPDAEIKSYLVKRYGEFILYKPRVTGATLFLWFFPILAVFFSLSLIAKQLIKKTNT